jgi:hypothetical protein
LPANGGAPPPGELIHHSYRGAQYACADYVERLQEAGAQPSMSRGGCPYHNAKVESFMNTLKQEEVDGSDYRDLVDARARIGRFLEDVYNRQRRHSALDYYSPEEFELIHGPCGLSPAAHSFNSDCHQLACLKGGVQSTPVHAPYSLIFTVSPQGCGPLLRSDLFVPLI